MADKLIDISLLSKYKDLTDMQNVGFFVAKSDIATSDKLGTVKVGSGLSVNTDGVLSAEHPIVLTTQNISVGDTVTDGTIYFVYE